jgi:NAD(P)-dependent dehydrogenase (short-subunit alcohol dehydrogenase family)
MMDRKIVLVTGGSKGIGLETVRRYCDSKFTVVTCARNIDNWQLAVEKYPQLSNVDFQPVDIAESDQVESFFNYVKSQYGRLDVCVNNASPKLASQGCFSDVPTDGLFNTLMNDFWAHAMCLQKELKLAVSGSAIVNVSSVKGFRATPNAAMYSAAKHGIEGLTHSVALEAIKEGIRVNSIAPGATWTPRWQERVENANPNLKQEVEDQLPIKRFGTPAEIVNAIEWLCSEQASYVVGHTLVVDGGLSIA